jgi:hypothetical protein
MCHCYSGLPGSLNDSDIYITEPMLEIVGRMWNEVAVAWFEILWGQKWYHVSEHAVCVAQWGTHKHNYEDAGNKGEIRVTPHDDDEDDDEAVR